MHPKIIYKPGLKPETDLRQLKRFSFLIQPEEVSVAFEISDASWGYFTLS